MISLCVYNTFKYFSYLETVKLIIEKLFISAILQNFMFYRIDNWKKKKNGN